jgi:hypothetical protein
VACHLQQCYQIHQPLHKLLQGHAQSNPYYQKFILCWGQAVAQLVEALCFKPEGRGFDSRWCHSKFSLTYSFRPNYGPGVDSASNRNEYQEQFLGGEGGRCVRLTTLPPSCANCLEIWEPQPRGTLRACQGLEWDCVTFIAILCYQMRKKG